MLRGVLEAVVKLDALAADRRRRSRHNHALCVAKAACMLSRRVVIRCPSSPGCIYPLVEWRDAKVSTTHSQDPADCSHTGLL